MADSNEQDPMVNALQGKASMWDRMIQGLFGTGPGGQTQPASAPLPASKFEPAPILSDYPTDEDAENAKKYGFGYGRGIESHVAGDVARVRGHLAGQRFPVFVPQSARGLTLSEAARADDTTSRNLDLTKPEHARQRDDLENVFARAALTINRMPIAALGFDPTKMVADTAIGPRATYSGVFDPDKDSMYFNATAHSTPVHESLHRGIEMLRKNPEAADVLRKIPNHGGLGEEYLVRHLMKSDAGDPERHTGTAGLAQREMGQALFGSGQWAPEIDKLNRIAQDMIAARRPRGPI